jgi:chitin synthase
VSWGTKGSDKAEALPSVSSKTKDAETVVEDTHKPQEDVDAAFKETVTRAITKVQIKEVVEKPTLDDQNKTFRTRLVAFWMLTNAGLAVAIENINGLETGSVSEEEKQLQKKQNIYFAIILYSTFGLAAVRFVGVCCFRTSLRFVRTDTFPVCVLLLEAESLQMVPEKLISLLPFPLPLLYILCFLDIHYTIIF